MKHRDHVTKKNVFEDLGFNKAEAINLKVRSELMITLRDYIEKKTIHTNTSR